MGDKNETFFVEDLVRCTVFTTQGKELGPFRRVIKTGANDVYVIGDGSDEILIPALKTVVKKIDLENRRIEVDLPEGLTQPGQK